MLDQTVSTLQQSIIALVRQDRPDLSTRQLGIFLIYYLEKGPLPLGSLAKRLKTDKPAISRAIDRLCQLDLVRRNFDISDYPILHLKRTKKGSAFLQDLRSIMSESQAVAREERLSPRLTDRMSVHE
jgi:DNA-binding MarR family transcriptional regulator